jgi:signal transduction histidine kinase
VPRYHADGSVAGFIGSAIDVTERRLAQEALASIDQRLIEAQEEERGRIARELHDDINQRLALLSIRLSEVMRAAPELGVDEKRDVQEAREEVLRLARDVQSLSHRLHPARIEVLGLAAAAEALCREVSQHRGVEVDFSAENVPEGLPKRIALCVYRVLQEALQNAIKHSGAREVQVALAGRGDRLELTVRDLGIGFDPNAVRRSGLGMISMKERLTAVNGRLAIRSEPAHGTTVHVSVPVREG